MLGRRAFGVWKASERAARPGSSGSRLRQRRSVRLQAPPCGPARGPVADATELPDGPSPAARVPAHRARGAAARSSPARRRRPMTPEQETRLAEQIAALHDTVAELAAALDTGAGLADPAPRVRIDQLSLRAGRLLLRVRAALEAFQ